MRQRHAVECPFGLDQLGKAFEEPRRDPRDRAQQRGVRMTTPQQRDEPPQPRIRGGQERDQILGTSCGQLPLRIFPEPAATSWLERADRFQQSRPELAVDGHGLAGRLHLHAQLAIGGGELVEWPARQLDDHVVDRRLESGRSTAGRGIRHLVEAAPERDERRDPGDRVAGRFAGEGG